MKYYLVILILLSFSIFKVFAGEDEISPQVGPDKGILEKKEEKFRLAPEAIKTMEIETKPYSGGSVTVDRKSIVFAKSEKSIFRVHEGWFERIPIKVISRDSNTYTLTAELLVAGDQIVISGIGFLRIAEIFAEEGDEQSHAH